MVAPGFSLGNEKFVDLRSAQAKAWGYHKYIVSYNKPSTTPQDVSRVAWSVLEIRYTLHATRFTLHYLKYTLSPNRKSMYSSVV